jgi:hypothetical protein
VLVDVHVSCFPLNRGFHMGHRMFAVFAVICFALEGAGCAWIWKSKGARGEEILMPLQTGSVLHRRVIIPTEPVVVPKKSKQKKESKATSPKPPAPEVTEEDETPSAPERFR